MPTLSPIYKFPAPTAAEASDGPAAFSALNSRVEREMPQFRGLTIAEREAPVGMSFLPTYTLVYSSDHAMSIIGWADITCEIAITSGLPGTINPNQNIGGSWRIMGNGVQLVAARWHNYAAGGLIRTTLTAGVAVVAATTNLTIRVEIGADPPSGPAFVQYVRTQVRRYGAPAT